MKEECYSIVVDYTNDGDTKTDNVLQYIYLVMSYIGKVCTKKVESMDLNVKQINSHRTIE